LSERYQDDELEADEEESAGDVEVDQEYSDRSPTPVPPPAPPPPPKPEKLTYQQKFLLRGHLRGVSAVKFSPDSTMIATGGMFICQA
jgi:COMPASS component SWD3